MQHSDIGTFIIYGRQFSSLPKVKVMVDDTWWYAGSAS